MPAITPLQQSAHHLPQSNFPESFQCYRPPCHKVYGCICISPANKVLLVKGRATGKWSFPKGHKFRSESYLECARRETREETGLDLGDLKPIAFHKLSFGEYYFFEVPEELAPQPRDTTEVEEACWMALNEIRKNKVNVDVNYFLGKMKRGGGFGSGSSANSSGSQQDLKSGSTEAPSWRLKSAPTSSQEEEPEDPPVNSIIKIE